MNKLKALLIIAATIPALAHADFLSELEKMNLSQLNHTEAALIVDLKERTDQTYKPAKISFFAASARKKESDKKKLIDSLMVLLPAKVAVLERVEERRANPSFNDMASVTLTDIKVKSPTRDEFPHASSRDTVLVRGDLVKQQIVSSDADFPITYRIAYSEGGAIRVQGVKVIADEKTSFTATYGNHDYEVSAWVKTSKSGWN